MRLLPACFRIAFAALLPLGAAAATFDPEAGLPLIRNFPPEVYRGHSQIFATTRGADGVMYFGTYGAVVSFDGERWRQFALPGTWTRTLTTGPDGLIYVGGGGMIGRLEPAPGSGELRFVSLADRLPEAQRGFASVWSAATVGDRVFFAIDGAVFAWRDGAFRVWPFPGQRAAMRSAGAQLFCHVGDQLLRWAGDDWQPFASDARLAAVRRLTVLPAERGVLVALDNGAILHVNEAGTLAPWPTPAAEFFQRAGIRNGLRLADGGYVFSTAGEGLVQLAADGTPVRRLTVASGLAHAATYGLGLGRDGHVWVETANGLSVFDPLAPWSFFDLRNGRPDTIGGEALRFAGDMILSVSDVPPLRLTRATDAFGAAQLVPFSTGTTGRLSNGVVMHGGLLNGGERGVVRLDGVSHLLHPTTSQVEDLVPLRAMPDVLVIGMLRGVELARITPQFAVTRLGRVPDFDLETTNIVEARDRTVWIGTSSGVALRLQLAADGTIASQTRFDATRGLAADAGWVKLHVLQNEILVCLKSGVFRLDATGESFTPDPRFAPRFPAGINTLPLESDGQGRVWFQVRRPDGGFELGRLDLRDPTAPVWTPLPETINAALGFGGARMITYLRENGGEFLWVSGTRSTARLDLAAAAAPVSAPPGVVINDLGRGAQRWQPGAGALALPFSREPLRLLFASPAAVGTSVSYETRLLGYDPNWTPATSPEATYTNLFGGPFTLEVRARDAAGRAGEVARATFSIAPPWHRTAAAYALYALAAGAAIFGFVRWRLGRAEREQRRLAALVTTRTAELATARDQAEAANRAKSAFLAAMSHELRTPLNGVIGYAQILQADTRLAPDQQERVRIVQHSGEHLLRMINDVLDLAKIEAGKIELRPAPLALGELLRDIAAAHAPAAAAKGLAFTLDPAADLPATVIGDAQKLRQVLDNLLGNAIKFTASGNVTLQVSCRAGSPDPASSRGADAKLAAKKPPASNPAGSGDPALQLTIPNSQPSAPDSQLLRFSLIDTGPGIAPADQARLFQPFEQAAATRGDAPGTGLGLAISRALVERMGGTLALASEFGRGSTFSFSLSLPSVEASPATDRLTARITGYNGPHQRVLIVDDHAVNRRLIVDLLAPLGFACTEFSSGSEALARLTTDSAPWPDLAVLDVRMAGLDGLALTRALRRSPRGRDLKILLMSASVLSFDPAAGRDAGADDFLAKPFRTPDLLEKIARLLAVHWEEAPAPPPAAPIAHQAIPPEIRTSLLDVLAQGDLEAFRGALASAEAEHPECAAHWRALDAAAGAFQLSRLRELLG